MRNLVIVESPTKARTIGKFLGNDYEIKFSMGHIIDLPKSKLGVAVEDGFTPQYEVIADKKKIIADLRASAKKADTIILATDPDREGEAIASNIKDVLSKKILGKGKSPSGEKNEKFKRIVFHEITEAAIKEALASPRDVDVNLVNAQTARRVLDRLVGYQLSPVLWKKVRRGLSAGRVQSVTLRLIVEREREIEKFAKEPYWTVHALFTKLENDAVEFTLLEINGEKIETSQTFTLYDGEYKTTKTIIDSQNRAEEIAKDITGKNFTVADVIKRQIKRSPYAPFTTSTMQQDASRRYGFSGKRTMRLAQKLYEEGFITYHRTDSVILSRPSITQIRTFIQKEYGEKYVPEKPRIYSAKQKLAQEAHEGIRPTKIQKVSLQANGEITNDHTKLYELIWKRTAASQMSDALIESTTVYADSTVVIASGSESISNNNLYRFKSTGSVLLFDGFLKLTPLALQDRQLPQFISGESLTLSKCFNTAHETQPPPRYNEASLIAALEEKGIGRPSTYASIVATLIDRGYAERIEKRFEPTVVGKAVNDFLVTNFSAIDDIPFTAEMEDKLDSIAQGKKEWVDMMRDFYTPFEKKISEVESASRVKIETQPTSEICPLCGANVVIRYGKFGKFLSCSKFPECKFTKSYAEETNLTCPKDNGNIIVKKTRKGRKFFGCSNYPACDFAAWKLEDIKNYDPNAPAKNKTETKMISIGKEK